MRTDRSDRELVIGFATLCVALLLLAGVVGLGVRLFLWAAGF